MIPMLRTVLALSLVLLSPVAVAGDAYRVSATLSHAGEAFATPELLVAPGKPATISTYGTGAYTLSITVDPLADGTLRVAADLASGHGDMAPVLVVKPGEPAAVSVGALGLSVAVTRRAGNPAAECTAQRLRPFVGPTGVHQAWPTVAELPEPLRGIPGLVFSDEGMVADGYQHMLLVDAGAPAAYVVQQGGIAGLRTVYGPLPVAACTAAR